MYEPYETIPAISDKGSCFSGQPDFHGICGYEQNARAGGLALGKRAMGRGRIGEFEVDSLTAHRAAGQYVEQPRAAARGPRASPRRWRASDA